MSRGKMTLRELSENIKQIQKEMKIINWRQYAQIAIDERKEAFMRSEDPTGKRWKELKPETIRRKAQAHRTTRYNKKQGVHATKSSRASKFPEKPLIDSEQMMNARWEKRKNGFAILPVQSRIDIGQYHDEPTARVQRMHWAIYPKARTRIVELWNQHLAIIFRKFW